MKVRLLHLSLRAVRSGRAMARIGLRMMPTFHRPPWNAVGWVFPSKMFSTTFYWQCGEIKDVAKLL